MPNANNISELDSTAGNNSALAGTSILGTGLVSTADDSFRNLGSFLSKQWSDLGGVNTVGGTGDAITVTTVTIYTALKTGMFFRFVAGAANTAAATLNLDGIGAKAVRKISGGTDVALVAGDLVAGETYTVIYRASANSAAGAWVLVGRDPSALSKTNNLSDVASAATSRTNLGAVGKVVTQVFTGSGTYTPTANMVYCIMEAVGGGGGGGGIKGLSGSNNVSGGGGGAGGYSRAIASAATIGASQTVTIGAAGTAGTAGGGTGGTGGATSVGALCVANGGVGGGGTNATINWGESGTGGAAGTGNVVASTGAPGQAGPSQGGSVQIVPSGVGGSGPFGGGSAGVIVIGSAIAGNAGTGKGSGGSGANAQNSGGTAAGGAGTAGYVVITEFCSA